MGSGHNKVIQIGKMTFYVINIDLKNRIMSDDRDGSVDIFCLPSLSPPGLRALLSPGQVFLLTVMLESSQTLSTLEPSIPRGLKSHNSRWLSVPPVNIH